MLKIGLNEDLILFKVEFVEKEGDGASSIDFHFTKPGIEEYSPFSLHVNTEGYAETETSWIQRYWALKPADPEKFGKTLTKVEIATSTLDSIVELQNLLRQFALIYTTSDNVDFGDYLRNTTVTPENWKSNLPVESTLLKITKNLVTDFNKAVGDIIAKKDRPIRLLLVRQSKARAYPSFRRNGVTKYPIVEDMKIPISQSKLSFTQKEIEKGYASDLPFQVNPDDSTPSEDLSEDGMFAGTALDD